MGLSGLPDRSGFEHVPLRYISLGTDALQTGLAPPRIGPSAENYTVLDNLQWTVGKHSFTFGGQVAWMLYNVNQRHQGRFNPNHSGHRRH